MKEISFIHGADLHLDSPMSGLKTLPGGLFKRLQESTFRALSTLVDAAIGYQVDFVILAGDIFDQENRSIRAQARFRHEMKRLEEEGIPCFIVFGNHDHLGGEWHSLQLPANVHVFANDVEMKKYITRKGAVVHLYGFSYGEKHISERKIDHYKKSGDADFHIGILHGNLEGNNEHGNYAPFQLNDLLEKQFHYWALGHIHKRQVICENPPVVYPGNIQGRHRKETGIKGCWLVSLANRGHEQLEFIPTSDCLWEEIRIDGKDAESVDDLYHLCRKGIESARKEGLGIFALLTVHNLFIHLQDEEVEDLLQTLQEEEGDDETFVWPIDLKFEYGWSWNEEALKKQSDFYKELFNVLHSYDNFEKTLGPLFIQSKGRKFLASLNEEDFAEIKKEAEQLLLKELLR